MKSEIAMNKKIRTAAVSVLAAAMLMLSGCAETPDIPAVMKKDIEQMLKTADSLVDKQTPVKNQLNAPERYSAEIRDKKGMFSVYADAEVIVPDVNACAIVSVKEHEITQDEVDLWTDVLFHEKELYDVSCFSEMTKAEIEEYITQLKRDLAELAASEDKNANAEKVVYETPADDGKNKGENVDYPVAISVKDEISESITALQKALKTAPEERELIKTDNRLTYHEGQDFTWTMFAAQNDDGKTIKAMNAHNNSGLKEITYVNRGDSSYNGEGSYISESEIKNNFREGDTRADAISNAPWPNISEAEAIKLGDDFISALGIDMEFCRADRMISICRVEDIAGNSMGKDIKGWRLIYTRNIGGIPVTHTNISTSAPSHGEWWGYERLTLFVTDDGVIEAKLSNLYDVGETLCENCKLMSFDEIAAVFKNMMKVKYGALADNVASDTFNITSIRFGYTRILGVESDFEGMMIPAWSFFGTREITLKNPDGTQTVVSDEEGETPFLTINAVDGTIIDVESGY